MMVPNEDSTGDGMGDDTGDGLGDDTGDGMGDDPKAQREWHTYVVFKRAFSPEECAEIVALGGETRPGTLQDNAEVRQIRDSAIAWIGRGERSEWLYRRLDKKLAEANDHSFHLELSGFRDALQLSEYGPGQHYKWHLDLTKGTPSVRKLSLVVQLSDPADYEGGALQITASSIPTTLPRDRGALIAFPSFILHRVTPVTSGLRRSLVGWINGPPLR